VEELKYTLSRPTYRVWDAWKFDKSINAGSIEEFRGLTFLTVRAAGYCSHNSGTKYTGISPKLAIIFMTPSSKGGGFDHTLITYIAFIVFSFIAPFYLPQGCLCTSFPMGRTRFTSL
jgi:hypothetical protein